METATRFCRKGKNEEKEWVSEEVRKNDRASEKRERRKTDLVSVDQGVADGDNGGEVDGEGDGGNGLDGGQELVDEGLLVDVEHLRSEDGSVVEDLDDGHSVREGGDLCSSEEDEREEERSAIREEGRKERREGELTFIMFKRVASEVPTRVPAETT